MTVALATWVIALVAAPARAEHGDKMPIHKVRVINARYSGMDRYFPTGRVLDTDHAVVMMVGPNGSGKTGFLRMVASSHENRRYFEEHGVSRVWDNQDLQLLVKDAAAAAQHSPGWRKMPGAGYGWQRILRPEFAHLNLGLSHEADAQERGLVSERAIQAITGVEGRLREPTDGNRFGYMKLETTEPVFIQELAAPIPPDHPTVSKVSGWHDGYQPFSYFDPSYDGKYSPLARQGKIQSPGEMSIAAINTSFDRMRQFMEEGVHYPFAARPNFMEMGYLLKLGRPPEGVRVPGNARLVVFMDEQTAFLDPRNAEIFRKKLIDAVDKYHPRLQIFLTTNDRYFLEHAPRDSAVISLYDQPAVVSTPAEVLRGGSE